MHVGERIGAYRKRRGMSQDALAGLIGMSRSWLSQVERGIRGVDRLSTLNDLATVLRVDVADLIGRDWVFAPDAPEHVTAVDVVRSQLASYRHLLGEPATPWPLPQLRNGAVQVNQGYQAAQYQRATAMLPALLEAADAYDGYQGRDGREIHLARCSVYAATAKLLTKVGENQLGWLAADRASHAALAAESKPAQGMAAYQVVIALLRSQRTDDAERIAVRSAEGLMSLAGSDSPDAVSLAGSLWLISSVIAARRSDRATSTERLATATQLGDLLAHDGNHWWTAFGPTNVLIHRASVAAEFGDPSGVLRVATEIDTEAMPAGLQGRRSRLHIDLAWAQAHVKNDMEAILHLQQAERVAPESIRYHTIARELVRELLKRSRKPSPALTAIATRAGVLA
ncbi:helix-turn-helix domain-containing protein [Kribbella sp. VKM Ac-2566]|uniref:helix-turn-helix domain-containing protein n=1 Tax=Kribbella sp. VKM Ac-2566 TaxID=2512218 RepID=UPI0010E6ABE9|nr:helix-turn-helix transcriptional regulator [Kribbella sp. VKM Ac-2566]TDW91099.1 transcriptional regulator with XRE-family HTH domain [Kribbella sp. VKM Ac-2566]